MMDWIQQAVRDFGDTLDIDHLQFDAGQGIELALESGELVGIASSPELALQEILVNVGSPLAFDPLPQMELALRHSNARHGPAPYMQAAIIGSRLVLAIRLDAREFSLPALDDAVWRLVDIQHEAATAN
jgi:type III secretion system chaperone SycN